MIRKAEKKDIPGIIALLHQVNMVHYELRPDLFKPHTTKYNEQELESLLQDPSKPVFVYDDGGMLGYAFCPIGCHNITLNVWEGNDPALSFYRKMGMQVQKTTMEVVLK